MLSLRSAALRRPLQQLSRSAQASFRVAERPAWQRFAARRGYASGHGEHKEGSDIPWAIGSVVVTVAGCGWVLRNGTGSGHGGDHGHDDAHAEKHEEAEEQEQPEEKSEDTSEEKSDEKEQGENKSDKDDKSEEKPEDKSDDKSDDEADDKSDKSDAESKQKAEEKKAEAKENKPKAAKSADAGGEADNNTAPAGEASDPSKIQESQKGLSNTPTKHSTDPANNPEMSKKPEGAPDTAKLPGPIDPQRGK